LKNVLISQAEGQEVIRLLVLLRFYHSQYSTCCEIPVQGTGIALLLKVPAIQLLHPKC